LYNDEKGFGFIAPDDGSADLVVYHDGILKSIKDGQKVSFRPVQAPRGMKAVDVSPL
jgi:CspA family cold shock protein